MVSNERHNVNMLIKIVFLCLFISCTNGRIHKLNLEEDARKQITMSTFGFLKGGTLAINITSFIPHLSDKDDLLKAEHALFGFTLDKSRSPGLSSYMEGMQDKCILNNNSTTVRNENMKSVFFLFDFKQKRLKIDRVGDDMKMLLISEQPRKEFLIANRLNRRDVAEHKHSKLSDGYLVGSRRRVREAALTTARPTDKAKVVVVEGGSTDTDKGAGSKDDKGNNPDSPKAAATKSPSSVPGAEGGDPPAAGSDPPAAGSNPPVAGSNPPAAGIVNKTVVNDTSESKSSSSQGTDVAAAQDAKPADSVAVAVNSDGVYQTYFLVYVRKPEEEGLYNLFFHNCRSYRKDLPPASISLSITITEDNNGNFLTAGEMPVPALYFTFSVLFFIAGVAWLSVLRRSKDDVYKIHYLMLVVVFVKSLACLFHGVNMYFIQITGIHEDAWAILWYIVYLTRGALMFVTVLLIGAGWAFIKHVLTDKEKKLFLIIIPLQILDRVAEVIVEESEEGNQSYMTWKEIFILVDLLCCGAILFPVVWSIRHLQEASHTDGKAAINLQKLKLFRHFYILVVCYIYFTRIIVYLMKITLPFKLEWLTDLFTELAMMIFLTVTGIKFRPATDNPYLQVPLDSDDEDIEMEEVLTKTGSTEGVVRVNQKTEGATNQIKQRESSHEYD